jgi:hypothetical protein
MMNGVVVVRPRVAWLDDKHFLHRRVDPFQVAADRWDNALGIMSRAVAPRSFRRFNDWPSTVNLQRTMDSSPDAERSPDPYIWSWAPHRENGSFEVSFAGGSLLEALNALVTRPGSVGGWILNYCRAEGGLKNAVLTVPIADDLFGSRHWMSLRGTNGFGDPCIQSADRQQ